MTDLPPVELDHSVSATLPDGTVIHGDDPAEVAARVDAWISEHGFPDPGPVSD